MTGWRPFVTNGLEAVTTRLAKAVCRELPATCPDSFERAPAVCRSPGCRGTHQGTVVRVRECWQYARWRSDGCEQTSWDRAAPQDFQWFLVAGGIFLRYGLKHNCLRLRSSRSHSCPG